MDVVRSLAGAKEETRRWLRSGASVGFVPTMGYLHAGHLSLVARARAENDRVAVSIFVNPAQFGPHEDLTSYPRDADGDRVRLETAGVDLLLCPSGEEMYPKSFQTFVDVSEVSRPLCGSDRPGHFRGVATIVTKLLNIVAPHRAYFGAKDFQQSVVVRQLVRDLNMDTEVVVCPTVREEDGLAMSSRNAYLGKDERRAATVLYRALTEAAGQVSWSPPSRAAAVKRCLETVVASEPLAQLHYAAVLNADTLEEIEVLRGPTLLALAVTVGTTRLIDNLVVAPGPR